MIRKFPWVGRKNVGLEMVKLGWATVYRSANAEYAGILNLLEEAEEKAKRKKKGMWISYSPPPKSRLLAGLISKKAPAFETPAEYKKRHASL